VLIWLYCEFVTRSSCVREVLRSHS
jgi:hypothetical protein